MTTRITTNLIGRKVKVTMGLTDQEIEHHRPMRLDSGNAGWRQLGEFGEVSAIWRERGYVRMLVAIRGELVEVSAEHVRLLVG